MKNYNVTVRDLHATLSEMIAQGLGDLPFVVRAHMGNGESICPISAVATGPMKVSRGSYGGAWIDEAGGDGEHVAFVETPAMVPCDFWGRETEVTT